MARFSKRPEQTAETAIRSAESSADAVELHRGPFTFQRRGGQALIAGLLGRPSNVYDGASPFQVQMGT